MTKEYWIDRINSIKGDAERLEDDIRALSRALMRYPMDYPALCEDTVRRGEWLACRLRHLLYATTPIRKSNYLLKAAEVQGIEFEDRDGIFKITLPGIAPGNKKKRPSEFLYDPLTFALEEYCRKNRLPRYRHCVVSFILIYEKEMFKGPIPDADNLELKLYLDVAASYLLVDDSLKYIDIYHSAEVGEHHAVEMYFMERDRFPQWLREREDRDKTGG